MLKWQAAARTDAGCQRQRNEDNYWMSPDHRVFAVADGMGGAVGGSRASKLAVEAIEKLWQDAPLTIFTEDEIKKWLESAVAHANSRIWS